ncbi:MAG: DJ-1/PfpI family protein [Myxococcota bacterium]|nr:DJ-1/PfpI family protein [Myxococcota bacterium]
MNADPVTIGIVLFEDAEELDWAGPYEVFGMATMALENARVVTIAESLEAVRCFNGLRVLPDHDFSNAPELDVVLVPGGQGTRKEIDNPVITDWLAKIAPRCQWLTSVCTGSLLLHAAGLTDGKRITTHWGFIEQLRDYASKATVLADVRYVRDGNLVTAAGVSAGIDMSLWLVGQIWGVEHARGTQRLMEYDPAPPYTADV